MESVRPVTLIAGLSCVYQSQVYASYGRLVGIQKQDYEAFEGPVRRSTMCRMFGCRRVFGAKGCCFCTEGCSHCDRKAGEPAPPREVNDFDDEFDASTVLMKVLGPPPTNISIQRWRYDPESGSSVLDMYPPEASKENSSCRARPRTIDPAPEA